MDKIHKRSNKHPKNYKKNQPLKVVYIGNPIKFKTSVSEFRALVQELTGQDSDVPDSTARFAVASGVSGGRVEVADGTKVAVEGSAHEVTKLGFDNSSGHGELVNGSGGLVFGSYDPEMFCDPEMIDDFPWGGGF